MTRAKFIAFAAIPSIVGAALLVAAYFALGFHLTPQDRGRELTRQAWIASFTERGLTPPKDGPREGFWETSIQPYFRTSSITSRFVPDVHLPGLIETDERGIQRYQPSVPATSRILIVGGSVAWGIGASNIDATYFSIAGRELEEHAVPTEIEVLAAPAWRSQEEMNSLINYNKKHFDLIVCLDGLNDITLSSPEEFARDEAIYGPGVFRHAGDYDARIARYLDHVRVIADLCKMRQSKLLVILQPSLLEKHLLSDREKRCLSDYWSEAPPQDAAIAAAAIRDSYQVLRESFALPRNARYLTFVDGSGIFDGEAATTFIDLWHFGDPGHRILGHVLAEQVVAVLGKPQTNPDGHR